MTSIATGDNTFTPGFTSKPKQNLRDRIRQKFAKLKGKKIKTDMVMATCYSRDDWSGPYMGPHGGRYYVNSETGRRSYGEHSGGDDSEPTPEPAKPKSAMKPTTTAFLGKLKAYLHKHPERAERLLEDGRVSRDQSPAAIEAQAEIFADALANSDSGAADRVAQHAVDEWLTYKTLWKLPHDTMPSDVGKLAGTLALIRVKAAKLARESMGKPQTYARALVERYAFQFTGPRTGQTRTVPTKSDIPKSVMQSGAYQEVHANETEKKVKESTDYKHIKRKGQRVDSHEAVQKIHDRLQSMKWETLRHYAYGLDIKGKSRNQIAEKVRALLLLKATEKAGKKEKLEGGKADGKPNSDFAAAAIKQGMKVEAEHTDDPAKAREIAKDHLAEDPKYYDKLAKMEAGKAKPLAEYTEMSDKVRRYKLKPVDVNGQTLYKVAFDRDGEEVEYSQEPLTKRGAMKELSEHLHGLSKRGDVKVHDEALKSHTSAIQAAEDQGKEKERQAQAAEDERRAAASNQRVDVHQYLDAMKMPKFSKAPAPWGGEGATGHALGQFVVHKKEGSLPGRGYQITHVPTGMRAGVGNSLDQAKRFAAVMHQHANWDFTDPKAIPADAYKIGAAISKANGVAGNHSDLHAILIGSKEQPKETPKQSSGQSNEPHLHHASMYRYQDRLKKDDEARLGHTPEEQAASRKRILDEIVSRAGKQPSAQPRPSVDPSAGSSRMIGLRKEAEKAAQEKPKPATPKPVREKMLTLAQKAKAARKAREAAAKPAEQPAKAKEPWEMTAREHGESEHATAMQDSDRKAAHPMLEEAWKKGQSSGDSSTRVLTGKQVSNLIEKHGPKLPSSPNLYDIHSGAFGASSRFGGEYWLSKTGSGGYMVMQNPKDWGPNLDHKNIVAKALAAGKTVPPHVLADYPDLAAKPPTQTGTIVPKTEGAAWSDKNRAKFAKDLTAKHGIDSGSANLLRMAVEKVAVDPDHVMKVAKGAAKVDGAAGVESRHIAEAIQYVQQGGKPQSEWVEKRKNEVLKASETAPTADTNNVQNSAQTAPPKVSGPIATSKKLKGEMRQVFAPQDIDYNGRKVQSTSHDTYRGHKIAKVTNDVHAIFDENGKQLPGFAKSPIHAAFAIDRRVDKPKAADDATPKRVMQPVTFTHKIGGKPQQLTVKSHVAYKGHRIVNPHKGSFVVLDRNGTKVAEMAGPNGAKDAVDKLTSGTQPPKPAVHSPASALRAILDAERINRPKHNPPAFVPPPKRQQAAARKTTPTKPAATAKPAPEAAAKPSISREDLRSGYEDQTIFRDQEDGIVAIPRLFKYLKQKHPDLTIEQLHDHLKGLEKEGNADLKIINEERLAKDPELSIRTPGGLKHYVYWHDKAAKKNPPPPTTQQTSRPTIPPTPTPMRPSFIDDQFGRDAAAPDVGYQAALKKHFGDRIVSTDGDRLTVKTKYGGPLADWIKKNKVGHWDKAKGAWSVHGNAEQALVRFLRMNPEAYERKQPETYGSRLRRVLACSR